jgi:hypothetical protein
VKRLALIGKYDTQFNAHLACVRHYASLVGKGTKRKLTKITKKARTEILSKANNHAKT